ncbi:Rrf2 family transcriptional regulator [bacterium]|nr:Rrf2 family transcriptional regulator [bacterium]
MKLGSGVEWSVHACTLLSVLPEGWSLPAEAIAEYHGVPPAYMAKHLQSLRRAGLVSSTRGAAGGYRLRHPPASISLWDIVVAIEGRAPAFRCTEIRQNGPCGARPDACRAPCGVAASFYRAEQAYRDSLRSVSLVDMVTAAAEQSDAEKRSAIAQWLQKTAVRSEA